MAITTAERNQIIELTVLMFNAAPGATYLAQIVALYEANPGTSEQKLQALANQLATTSVYRSQHPNFETAEEFAAEFLTPLGLQNDAVAKDFIIAKVNAGVSKGQIAYEAYVALNAVPSTGAAQYVAANAILNNKTTVAEYYSVTKEGAATDLASLQGVLGGVTADAASVTAAQAAIDGSAPTGGQTYSLTINQDALTGTGNNDTFNALSIASGGAQNNTLQGVDSVDGGAGTDTLNVTVVNADTTAMLTSVEVVNAMFASANTLNLTNATGVTNVNVDGSTAAGTVSGVGAAALGVLNQKQNVNFTGSTATTLALNIDTVGTVSATAPVETVIDLGSAAASKATTLNVTVKNSNVEIKDTTGGSVATVATVAATGSSEIDFTDGATTLTSLTVTGSGSLKVSEVNLVTVATLTAGDGGVTFTNGDSTATTFTATTGAGKDTLTVDGANVKSISTGAGADKVTTATAALVATATVDLGAGDDTMTLHAAPTAGVTLTAGDGKDTLAVLAADYATIGGVGFTDAQRAKITGFEILSLTDAAVANGAAIDLSKIAGLTSFQSKGVATGGAATVSNVGANADIIFKGALAANNGTLTVTLKDATGASDVVNLTLNTTIAQNNDGTVDTTAANTPVIAAGVETVNVNSTGTLDNDVTAGAKTDVASNTLALTDAALTTLNVTGDQKLTFTSAADMVKLATIDAQANTGGAVISVAAAAVDGTAAAITIKGSAGANTLTGSGNADVIIGGVKGDTITGGLGADTLTGGAGNDKFAYTAAAQSTLAKMDVIADFSANTYGNGVEGATGTGAAADTTKWNGDVITLDVDTGVFTKVATSVQTNAADATVFIQNTADATADTVGAALDSTTGRLYIDWNSDGAVDSVIQLTGASTINAAAFLLV